MSQQQAKTNAPLFYAQRLLSIYTSSQKSLNKQDQDALIAGVCLCLKESWLAWLDELSNYMNVDLSMKSGDEPLKAIFHADLPEGQLLLALFENPASWLRLLITRIDEPITKVKPIIKDSANSLALISLTPVDDDSVIISHVLKEFKEYIDSVRVRQLEW